MHCPECGGLVLEAAEEHKMSCSRWPATAAVDYDPTDEEQGPLEQGWAESRRYDKEHPHDYGYYEEN